MAAQGEVSIPGSPTSTMKRSSLPPLNSVEEEELLSAANTLTPERGVTHVYTEGVGRKGPDSSASVTPDLFRGSSAGLPPPLPGPRSCTPPPLPRPRGASLPEDMLCRENPATSRARTRSIAVSGFGSPSS